MSSSVWARVDVGFFDADWMLDLPAAAQLAWIRVVLHAKSTGGSQKRPGCCPSISPRAAARSWGVSPQDVEDAVSAAVRAGALEILPDGDGWRVTNSSHFVSDRTMRGPASAVDKAEKQASPAPDSDSADSAEKPESLSRDRTEQNRTEHEKKRSSSSAAPGRKAASKRAPNPEFEALRSTMQRGNFCRGLLAPISDQDVVRELTLKGPSLNSLLREIRELPEETIKALRGGAAKTMGASSSGYDHNIAVLMFGHAISTWSCAVTWQGVYRQRFELIRSLMGGGSPKRAPMGVQQEAEDLAERMSS